ncbi:hypothetical protein [Mycobacterium sp. URHB0021]
MTFSEADRNWRIPLIGQAPSGAPDEWVAALAAVALDLRCRRHGREVSLSGVDWELTVMSEGWVSIGMVTVADDTDLYKFSIGRGHALETTTAQAMVWVAEVVQEELAGYEFVQWPSDGPRLLTADLRVCDAVWIDPSTDDVVSNIGALCGAGENR